MSRRTLADALASRIPTSLNISPSDPRCVTYINSGTERCLHRGHWIGTTPKYTINVTSQLLSLPPQLATIEKVAVCQWPVKLRNQWAEFNDQGWGVSNDPATPTCTSYCSSQVLARGSSPLFQDILAPGFKIRAQCDVIDDVGVAVLYLGYDLNGNWVRTKVAGVWQDGETITLSQSPGTLSATVFSKITDIQKPLTAGQIWEYQIDGLTNPIIGHHQFWETRPSYPRYLIPTIPGSATQVDLIGKVAFYPVVNPTDYLIISNLEALRLACMSVRLEEEYNFAQAAICMDGGKDPKTGVLVTGAIGLLQAELQHYLGDGAVPTFNIIGAEQFGCPVEQLV
jgi:hypothetical protein